MFKYTFRILSSTKTLIVRPVNFAKVHFRGPGQRSMNRNRSLQDQLENMQSRTNSDKTKMLFENFRLKFWMRSSNYSDGPGLFGTMISVHSRQKSSGKNFCLKNFRSNSRAIICFIFIVILTNPVFVSL